MMDPRTQRTLDDLEVTSRAVVLRPARTAAQTSTDAGFVAELTGAGPEGEADYTDARYWVREVDDTTPPPPEGATDPTAALVLTPKPAESGGRWVTATNLTELGLGPSGAGLHLIRKTVSGIVIPRRVVHVRALALTTGLRYVFESYPGQLQEGLWAFKVTCLDGNGCPVGVWYEMDGAGFVAQADPPACP